MQRALMLALVLLATPLVGCLGGGGGDDDQLKKSRAQVTGQTGGIEGTVTDATIAPVVGAVIEIVENGMSAVAADDGSFAFSNVPPGEYMLQVTADGFIPSETPVVVAAGRVAPVDILLAALPHTLPYVQTLEFTGFVECSVRALYGVAVCGIPNDAIGGNVTNDRFLFTWPVEADPWQIVAELQWEAGTPAAEYMSFTVESLGIPNEDHTSYGDVRATAPIVISIDRETIEGIDANVTAICNGEMEPSGPTGLYPTDPESYCIPPLVDGEGSLMARIFVEGQPMGQVPEGVPEIGGANIRAGAAVQQEYTVIVTLFHHAPACAEYSVFLGNTCAQEALPREIVDPEPADDA